jgi:hypothetical protein
MIDAMKQAIEALKETVGFTGSRQIDGRQNSAITALRQAIEEAESQTHTDHPSRHWDRTCPACVAEAGEQDVPEPLMKIIREKFTSGNSVAVERITLKLSECETALAKPEQEPVDTHCPSCLHPFFVVPVAKREWVGLTDEEVVACGWCDLNFARAIEATLKEKNEIHI